MSLNIGDQAPQFSGTDLKGNAVALSDYSGSKNVFLVFYVKAFSGVCAVQLPRYNSNLDGFRSRDCEVIAVSVDNAFSQEAFCNSMGGIDYPMLSDMTLEIAESYGVKLPGHIANRAEFLIDKAGKVRWSNVEKSPGDDTATIEDIFGALDAL